METFLFCYYVVYYFYSGWGCGLLFRIAHQNPKEKPVEKVAKLKSKRVWKMSEELKALNEWWESQVEELAEKLNPKLVVKEETDEIPKSSLLMDIHVDENGIYVSSHTRSRLGFELYKAFSNDPETNIFEIRKNYQNLTKEQFAIYGDVVLEILQLVRQAGSLVTSTFVAERMLHPQRALMVEREDRVKFEDSAMVTQKIGLVDAEND